MKRAYFGTDGIRGPFGGPVVNPDFAARLGRAAAAWLPSPGVVLIGRDTRASGVVLERALARGLAAGGARPYSLGIGPTPAVARAVREEGAALGVVVTASHNPAGDNGIKFFGPGGLKLPDVEEARMESLLPPVAPGDGAGAEVPPFPGGGLEGYRAATGALLPAASLRGWRIVVDCAHGATGGTTPAVLRGLGAEVVEVGTSPDGTNINEGVGSEHPALLAARVRAERAVLGIAHDGDGDRCVLCDEQGGILDGDEILTLLATEALRQGRLVRNTLVVTVQSNLGVDAAVAAAGGRVLRTAVGDRYVIERMRAEGATLGGESSGHIVCSELSPTGDGLVAALRVIGAMRETGQPLSALRGCLRKFPQGTAALRVRTKVPLERLPELTAAIAALEAELGARGRVLVRYSGTESKLRLLVEGPDEGTVAAGLRRLERAARVGLEVE